MSVRVALVQLRTPNTPDAALAHVAPLVRRAARAGARPGRAPGGPPSGPPARGAHPQPARRRAAPRRAPGAPRGARGRAPGPDA